MSASKDKESVDLGMGDTSRMPAISEPARSKEAENEHAFEVNGRTYKYIRNSCGLFPPDSKLRLICVRLINSAYWEAFILLLVLCNAILFALFDYKDREAEGERNQALYWLNLVFVIFYIIEALCKITAVGLFEHETGYLRLGWHYYDLFIIIVGICDAAPGICTSRIVGILRVMRMLKIAYTSTIMNKMMTPWMQSFKQMSDVLALLLMLLLFFSIIGLYAFKGDYYDRCRKTPAPVGDAWPLDESITRLCSVYGNGDFDCPHEFYCGNPDIYNLPMESENVSESAEAYYGTLNYDSAWRALLLNFQVITYDSWADVMYKAQDSNNTYIARIFFPILVFLGAFFCLNLIVGVVFETFQRFRELLNQSAKREEVPEIEDHGEEKEQKSEKAKDEDKEKGKDKDKEGDSENTNKDDKLVKISGPEKENNTMENGSSPRRAQQQKSTTSPLPSDSEAARKALSNDDAAISSDRKVTGDFRRICQAVASHFLYTPIVAVLIMGNMLAISLDRYQISDHEQDLIDIFDSVFFSLFLVEMAINISAESLWVYVHSPFNVTDMIINLLGVIEVALTYSQYSHSNSELDNLGRIDYGARGVIVIFRTCRAFKLAGKWPALRNTLTFFWNSRGDILNFAVLVCLFDFMFAIIGMELFAHEVKFNSENEKDLVDGESSRVNFDDIGHAMLSSFTIQISDNWATYYVLYMRFSQTKGTIYFILAIIVLNILLVNLFVGILLENFFSDDQKQAIAEEERRDAEFNSTQRKLGKPKSRYKHRTKTLLTVLNTFRAILSHAFWTKANAAPPKKPSELFGVSLGIFEEENTFRLTVAHAVKHYAFQILCYVMIFVNSVVLTFYTPTLDPNSGSYHAAFAFDVITTVFFCVEVMMKSVAFGFVSNGPLSYMRSPSNVLDFLITIIAILTFIFAFSTTAVCKLFLLFRILRALRLLDAYDGFKIRIQALVLGLGKIVQTLFITMLFILVFAIIGTHFFKGTFYYCDRTNIKQSESTGTAEIELKTVYDCLNLGGEWRSRDIGYDNVVVSSMTLFELFSGKSWCNTITFLPDIVDVDYEPVRDVSSHNLWFGIIYMIILLMIIRAVLSGVISNTFFVHNERLQGLHELTHAQRRWVSLSKVIFKYKPMCRFYGLYRLLERPLFKNFILCTILLNGVLLFLSWHRSPSTLNTVTEVFYHLILVVYTAEATMKLTFYRADYFADGWNTFDLVILVCWAFFTILDASVNHDHITLGLYWFRTCKLLVLFQKLPVLRKVFQMISLALPSIINIALLLFLIMYLFAIIGVFLFSGIKLQTYIEGHANFQNFWTAFLVVFRLSTFDGWNDLMHDAMRGHSQYFDCVDYPTYDNIHANGDVPLGCGMSYAPAFFISLIVVVPFIFLNLFVAVVVNTVMEITKLSESVLSDERLAKFLQIWKKYDPEATGFIEYSTMWHVLAEVGEPLGASEKEMNSRYYSAMTLWMLQLRIYWSEKTQEHLLAFYDVLEALVKKTIYRPQTLDKIYNNRSKEALVSGLCELWSQRAQLTMDDPKYVNKIEDLRHYYDAKMRKGENPEYVLIKARLPTVVWLILRICKRLRNRVKARKAQKKLDEAQALQKEKELEQEKAAAKADKSTELAILAIRDIVPEIMTKEAKEEKKGTPVSNNSSAGGMGKEPAEETGRALISNTLMLDISESSEFDEKPKQSGPPRAFWDVDNKIDKGKARPDSTQDSHRNRIIFPHKSLKRAPDDAMQ